MVNLIFGKIFPRAVLIHMHYTTRIVHRGSLPPVVGSSGRISLSYGRCEAGSSRDRMITSDRRFSHLFYDFVDGDRFPSLRMT